MGFGPRGLADVRYVFERILESEQHNDTELWFEPNVMQGFADLHGVCCRCGERWHFAGVNQMSLEDVVDGMSAAIGRCRGERLYAPIDGGPWLAYPRAAYEARRQ